jgi:hypothetical protein
LAVQKARITGATYESVTIGFNSGPNLVSYPYRVSCFSRESNSPKMTNCFDIPTQQANLAASSEGNLPTAYASISVTLNGAELRAAEAADCFIEVSGLQHGKCKYVGSVDFAENYPPCPLTCSDTTVGETLIVNGEIYTRRADFNGLTTVEEYRLTCTTGITDFSGAFLGSTLNPDINSWDTSAATTMAGMFRDASNFDQELTCWNVNPSMTCTDFGLDATTWISTYGTGKNNPPLSGALIAADCELSQTP